MCVDVSHVLKGQQFMTFMVFLFFSNDRSLLLLYCASQAPPCILIMGLYSVLFIIATVFIYGSIWLAKFNLKCKMQNGNAICKICKKNWVNCPF